MSIVEEPPTTSERELVLHHRQLALSLANRFRGRGESIDDLEQVAYVGLLKAAARYDPSRQCAFTTYAQATILGELKRHFRTRWNLHVARTLQDRYLLVRDIADDMRASYGREPTTADVARVARLSEAEVDEAQAVGMTFRLDSLDTPPPDGTRNSPTPTTEDPCEMVATIVSLRDAVARLPQHQQRLLHLRFTLGLSQQEIGDRVGLSQMAVSRRLLRIVAHLRRDLAQ